MSRHRTARDLLGCAITLTLCALLAGMALLGSGCAGPQMAYVCYQDQTKPSKPLACVLLRDPRPFDLVCSCQDDHAELEISHRR